MNDKNATQFEARNGSDAFPEKQDIVAKTPVLFSKRFLVIILLFLSYINISFQEFNINIPTIGMSSNKTEKIGNITRIIQEAEFQWDPPTIGLVISVSSYGKLLAFLSGLLITILGGSKVWVISTLGTGIMSVLQVTALRHNFYLFLACRFCSGIFQSFAMPSFIEVFSHWIPKSERATMTSICYNGFYIGIALVHPVCGLIFSEWGWPQVFYTFGIASMVLSIIVFVLVPNRPSDDRWISHKELAYILKETDSAPRPRMAARGSHKDIFTSPPVWALSVARFVAACVVTTLLSSLPLFMKDATNKDTKEVAFVSSLPNFVVIVFSLFAGPLLEYWKNYSNITATQMHKIVLGLIFGIQSASFLLLTFTEVSNLIIVIAIFILIRALQSFVIIILQLCSYTIAPNHTGIVAGFTFFWYSFGTIATQIVTGFMTTDHTVDEWHRCFLLTTGVTFFGSIIFTVYGSSDPQPWSLSKNFEKPPNSSNKNGAFWQEKNEKLHTRDKEIDL